MSLRPSTPQEILDAEGWLPFVSSVPLEIGSVVSAGLGNKMGIPADSQVVIIGLTSVEESRALLARHKYNPTHEYLPYWYKVVAE